MHLERAKIKGISQHLWAEMHMWIQTPGGKLAASNQGRAATSNNGTVRGSALPL